MVPPSSPPGRPADSPALVLGAGYAGIRLAHAVDRRSRGRFPVVLVDRHPVHVLRTELYEVGRLAEGPRAVQRFTLPLKRVLDGARIGYREGEVEGIDLAQRSVRVGGETVPFGSLALCLGSVPSYYGVPGAREHTHMVYRLPAAQRLASALREMEEGSTARPAGVRPEVVVVGGGSTGTEVAAEIATVNWARVAGKGARAPHVRLVAGAVPLLAGLSPALVRHARGLLGRAGVEVDEGRNVTEVTARDLKLQDGSRIPFDLCVWAAGVQAPDVIRSLPGPHGPGGRLKVESTLELPGFPGVFGVGDVAYFEDPETHLVAPATAQAALSEATVAGTNLVARREDRPLTPFRYREKGTIVSVGVYAASGTTRHLTLWGSPAKLLKRAVEREYAIATERSQHPLTSR